MRCLVFGDLHLGAGTALGRDPGDRLLDQLGVLDRIGELAVERKVDGILVAGDVFEGPLVTPEQLEAFAEFVSYCDHNCIPVVAITGNGKHDAAMRAVNGMAIFDHVSGIAVFPRPGVVSIGGVTIACLPWTSPARLVARMDGDVDRDRVNARAAELFVKVAAELRERSDGPMVLMLHGSISGASLPAGMSTDDLREPVIPLDELLDLGYAAVVASHIHVPQYTRRYAQAGWVPVFAGLASVPVAGEPDTIAIYTGSPLPLNFGEANTPHGVWILDLDETLSDAIFVPIESRPLQQTSFDIADLPDDDTALDLVYSHAAWPEVDGAIVKVVLRCTQAQQRRLDTNRLRETVLTAGAHTVKVEVETVREQRTRVDGVTGDLAPLDAFELWAAENTIEPELAALVREQLQHDLEAVGA